MSRNFPRIVRKCCLFIGDLTFKNQELKNAKLIHVSFAFNDLRSTFVLFCRPAGRFKKGSAFGVRRCPSLFKKILGFINLVCCNEKLRQLRFFACCGFENLFFLGTLDCRRNKTITVFLNNPSVNRDKFGSHWFPTMIFVSFL